MKSILAEQLLSRIMDWKSGENNDYITQLLYMSSVKYDGYDRFMPGTRFFGSLSLWLSQFEDTEDRKTMLEFIRKKLIFISSSQMSYLIKLLQTTKIKQNLLDTVCENANPKIPKYRVRRVALSNEYKDAQQKSMFVGLSDGAHMDVIRRDHGLNNEQVLTMYYPSGTKIKDMIEKLWKVTGDKNAKFENIFLIDDFTASGISFIRKEEDGYHGKLKGIFESIFVDKQDDNVTIDKEQKWTLKSVCSPNVRIYIYFCVATKDAINYIKKTIVEYIKDCDYPKDCLRNVDMVFEVNGVDFKSPENQRLKSIISKAQNFNEDVLNNHYKKGKHDYPWKGFNECGLTIVLNHNTPNNSLPILWQPDAANYPSLFTRISRH